MTTTVATSTLSVRLTIAEPEQLTIGEPEQPLNLNEFAAHFQNVRSLLFLCAMSEQPDGRQGSVNLDAATASSAVADSFAVVRGTRLVVQSLCDLGLVGRGPL